MEVAVVEFIQLLDDCATRLDETESLVEANRSIGKRQRPLSSLRGPTLKDLQKLRQQESDSDSPVEDLPAVQPAAAAAPSPPAAAVSPPPAAAVPSPPAAAPGLRSDRQSIPAENAGSGDEGRQKKRATKDRHAPSPPVERTQSGRPRRKASNTLPWDEDYVFFS